jgi:Ca-activated chloride channel family protein
LVHADAEVVEDGRIVTGLTKDHFRILDEGQPQPIVQFSTGEQALDLILLFDISGSMRWVVQQVAAASHQAFQELRPGDRVCVMVFNTKVREVAPFTDNLDAVRRTIQDDVLGLHFGGGTLIQTAVQSAAVRFRREANSERRRAVLIVTDNVGMRTRREQSVVRDFWESDALLSGLLISNKAAATRRTVGLVLSPLHDSGNGGHEGDRREDRRRRHQRQGCSEHVSGVDAPHSCPLQPLLCAAREQARSHPHHPRGAHG